MIITLPSAIHDNIVILALVHRSLEVSVYVSGLGNTLAYKSDELGNY